MKTVRPERLNREYACPRFFHEWDGKDIDRFAMNVLEFVQGHQTHEEFTKDDGIMEDKNMEVKEDVKIENKKPVEEKVPTLVPIYEFEDPDKRLKSMIIDDMQRTNTSDKPLKTHLHLLKELENHRIQAK
jgi:hypothetical protein